MSKAKKRQITYSEISSYLTCPRLHYYKYRVGGAGVASTTPHLPFLEGELGHYALYHFYKSGQMLRVNTLKRVEAIIDRARGDKGLEAEAEQALRIGLAGMMGATLGYKSHYRSDKERYEPVLLEEPFAFDLTDSVQVAGKIDAVMKDTTQDRLDLWEHKTAGRTPQGLDALPLSLQDLIYLIGARVLGHEVRTIQRNYIIKTGLRLRKPKNSAPENLTQFEARVQQQYVDEPEKKFFRPPPMIVTENTLDNVEQQLGKIWADMEENEDDPTMNFASCRGKFDQPCPFAKACRAYLDGNKDGWDAPECVGLYRQKDVPHPELKEGLDD